MNVVLGISGGIAAFKACDIIGHLKRAGCRVDVIMTQNAERFITRLTVETLSGNSAATDTFERPDARDIEHISFAARADVFVIAPATANVIGKIASGIADDMLTTTVMAVKAPVVICPAMNSAMLENPIVQQNLEKLKKLGYVVVESDEGMLACGVVGKGRLAKVEDIVKVALAQAKKYKESTGIEANGDKKKTSLNLSQATQDLKLKKILITAGATRENIDGVRYISNNSSGKMGMSLVSQALKRGAEVALVAGYLKIQPDFSKFSDKINIINVKTTEQMYDAVLSLAPEYDVIIKAAAPADYRIKNSYDNKIKQAELTLSLEKNKDIAAAVGKIKKPHQKLVIFSAETQDLTQNAKGKLKSKNADMVVANDVSMAGAGFDVDTNIVTIIKSDGSQKAYPKMLKDQVADVILDEAHSNN